MRLRCWLRGVPHRYARETKFIRRLDGYPLAAYGECVRCGKRTGLTYGRGEHAPFNADLAAELARDD